MPFWLKRFIARLGGFSCNGSNVNRNFHLFFTYHVAYFILIAGTLLTAIIDISESMNV